VRSDADSNISAARSTEGKAPNTDIDERAALITAAGQVLERSGWWGFKVESVLKQARLSTRSFYRHFEGKDELLAAVLERDLLVVADRVSQGVDASLPPEERVWAYVNMLIGWAFDQDFAKPAALFAASWRELRPQYGDIFERCIRAMTSPMTEALKDGVRTDALVTEDPEADAKAVFFLIGGFLFDRPQTQDLPLREELNRSVLPFIARSFKIECPPHAVG
jgi:AcrR family transcriptional regulator